MGACASRPEGAGTPAGGACGPAHHALRERADVALTPGAPPLTGLAHAASANMRTIYLLSEVRRAGAGATRRARTSARGRVSA